MTPLVKSFLLLSYLTKERPSRNDWTNGVVFAGADATDRPAIAKPDGRTADAQRGGCLHLCRVVSVTSSPGSDGSCGSATSRILVWNGSSSTCRPWRILKSLVLSINKAREQDMKCVSI